MLRSLTKSKTSHRVYIVTIILLTVLFAPTHSFSINTKIDPMLNLASQKGADLSSTRSLGMSKSSSADQEPLVSTLILFQGDLKGVESLGGRIQSVIGNIATVDIPLSAIDAISELPNIVYIEAAKVLKQRLDVSVPETGASILRSGTAPNWTGSTGKDVIIGIIDTGIDINHADFKDASGKTRILSLWDHSGTIGVPPAGYNYGIECTSVSIDSGDCTQSDSDGHGTHIAGIAAGNGGATGNGENAFRYIGMAPEADLVIVNALANSGATTDSILDGVAYILAKAAALGKPSVINLSVGGHFGPHDGTSIYERGLDNASGAGRIIVGAAGNEADANFHASGNVPHFGSTAMKFSIPSGSVEEVLDFWYSGADQMGISISFASCTTPIINPGSTYVSEKTCGLISIFSTEVNPLNNDREIAVFLEDGKNPLASGLWTVTLYGNSVTSNGRVDGWIATESAQFTTHIDQSITLDDSGTATRPISVAAYSTKKQWNSLSGIVGISSATLGDIAFFSSRGPRRSCSDSNKCPSIQKPEIATPGNVIMSSLSQQLLSPAPRGIDPDGVHFILAGTSVAAPHVAGGVALLLQDSPNLTPEEVKDLLFNNTFPQGGSTGTLPNNTWGYGAMDIKSAFEALTNSAISQNGGNGKQVVGSIVSGGVGSGSSTDSVSAGGQGDGVDSGGCVMRPDGKFDPMLVGLICIALVYLGWRRFNHRSRAGK